MAKYYDIDDIITDEEIAAVIFQKAASGLGIDPSSETDCADILLRGYFWWNSLCALQVPNQVFPKVPSKFAVVTALLQQLLLVVPLLLLQRRKRRRKSLLKSLMMTWVLVYFTKPSVIGVYFLMVYFRNVLIFGEFLSLILQNISSN
ncbi:uncharacterized protein LOC112011950 isoform X1 [Quercus suber]|uniref:uncharacterized protein LOC112011950 isoform X1 n=1 Tax=Quercus suber TaxID=58331 RepID=UPI0032DF4D37